MSAEDKALWDEFVQEKDILKEEEENFEELLACMDVEDPQDPELQKQHKKPTAEAGSQKINEKIKHPPQLDRRTAEKLRKGKIRIEARLDLHGKNQNQAHELLNNFITQSANQGLRCVLVITGKGKSRLLSEKIIEPEVGVLKRKVPEWLEEKIFSQHILRVAQAHPKDGGSGALYIYLKRQR